MKNNNGMNTSTADHVTAEPLDLTDPVTWSRFIATMRQIENSVSREAVLQEFVILAYHQHEWKDNQAK